MLKAVVFLEKFALVTSTYVKLHLLYSAGMDIYVCTIQVPPDMLSMEVTTETNPDERETQKDRDSRYASLIV